MIKIIVLSLLILLVLSSTPVQSTPVATSNVILPHHHKAKSPKRHQSHSHSKHKVKCAAKCMTKVKDVRIKKCSKMYKAGGVVHRCSIKNVKGNCRRVCGHHGKFCVRRCKTVVLCGKKVVTCKKVCTAGKKCMKKCCNVRVKKCILERLPGKWLHKCKFITKAKPFTRCLSHCTKHIKTRSCAHHCSTVKVPHKFKKCLRVIVKKGHHVKKCSVKKFKKLCHKKCKPGIKRCFRSCKPKRCGKHVFSSCKWKCTTSAKKCLSKCAWSKQQKCYIKRIPAKWGKVCSDMVRFKTHKRCLKTCTVKHHFHHFIRKAKKPSVASAVLLSNKN